MAVSASGSGTTAPSQQMVPPAERAWHTPAALQTSWPLQTSPSSQDAPTGGRHESTTAPFRHPRVPVAAQPPAPQVVGDETKSSSSWPSQSSSMPLQRSGPPVGPAGRQVFSSAPLTQDVVPKRVHAPAPQVVAAVV